MGIIFSVLEIAQTATGFQNTDFVFKMLVMYYYRLIFQVYLLILDFLKIYTLWTVKVKYGTKYMSACSRVMKKKEMASCFMRVRFGVGVGGWMDGWMVWFRVGWVVIGKGVVGCIYMYMYMLTLFVVIFKALNLNFSQIDERTLTFMVYIYCNVCYFLKFVTVFKYFCTHWFISVII